MTAIAILLLTFVRPGDVVVHSGPLYAATETIINKILTQFGVHYVDFPAGATREELDEVMARRQGQGPRRADLPRKPGQPDQRAGRRRGGRRRPRRGVRRQAELPPIAIDNTFLGPLWAKPLDAGRRHQRLQPDQICRRA